MDRSIHDLLMEDVKALLKVFDDFEVQHVRRHANEIVYHLAKYVCENKLCKTWLGTLGVCCEPCGVSR
jgi:hypothetical protein